MLANATVLVAGCAVVSELWSNGVSTMNREEVLTTRRFNYARSEEVQLGVVEVGLPIRSRRKFDHLV